MRNGTEAACGAVRWLRPVAGTASDADVWMAVWSVCCGSAAWRS